MGLQNLGTSEKEIKDEILKHRKTYKRKQCHKGQNFKRRVVNSVKNYRS